MLLMTTSPMVVQATTPTPLIMNSAQMSAPPGSEGSRLGFGRVSPPPRESSCQGINDSGAIIGKRHGRSSGMRHGWRLSWSGVRSPVRLSVQGPAGEVPATSPFSNPLHHRYRRWMGGVSRPHSFCLTTGYVLLLIVSGTYTWENKSKAPTTAHLQQRAPSLVPPSAGTASPPRSPPQLACRGDSNPRLQGSSRLHYRCGTRPKNLLYVFQLLGMLCLD